MITYGQNLRPPETVRDFLGMSRGVPDRVEIAESQETWTYAVRRSRRVEIVSKLTGRLVSSTKLEDALPLLDPAVASAARQAMSLRDSDHV
jgi:hypothetical protein